MIRKHILQNEAPVTVKKLTAPKIKQWGKQIVDMRSLRCRYERQRGLASPDGRAQGQAGAWRQPLPENLYKYKVRKTKETFNEHQRRGRCVPRMFIFNLAVEFPESSFYSW